MQSHINDDLAAMLNETKRLLADEESVFKDPARTLRYALLKRVEDDLDLPVLVKYGESHAVCDSYGRAGDQAWEMARQDDATLFYVEPEETLHAELEQVLIHQFASIGAWYVGKTGVQQHSGRLHLLFVWPDDHPVLSQLPAGPTDE